MEALLIYWLKANAVLALFAAAYYGLLRNLTFFQLNRAYLLLALGFAAAYPLLPVPALLPAMAPAALPLAAAGSPAGGSAAAASAFDWWQLAGAGYLAGAAGLLLRLLTQLLSLALLRRRALLAVVLGQPVRVVPGAGSPFSFGGTIYLTASSLPDADLALALRHEQTHVRQGHTLDVLLWQLATALCWANPAAWLLRRLALDNLEYLADAAALRGAALPRREYQHLLLRQQAGGVPAPALAFHFSVLTLKNRILMLNQPTSTTRQLGRYLLAAPLVVLLALGYTGARAQSAGPVPATRQPLPANALYFVDGQPSTAAAVQQLAPPTLRSVDVIKDAEAVQRIFGGNASEAVLVTTKANATTPAVLAFAERVGSQYPTLPIAKALNTTSAYTSEPAQVNAVVPKALAYITSHYPDARLGGEVVKLTQKSTGAVKYQVQLARGKRPFWVYFSPDGDFLGE